VTVLSSSRKRPWTLSGLAAALRRARIDAQKHAAKVAGVPFDEENPLPTGIEGLRFHDLRGTAATNFILAGLKLDEVALIMGWKLERVREIAARYVSGEAMGMAMVRRLGRNAPRAG
jgi:hypothetical protein